MLEEIHEIRIFNAMIIPKGKLKDSLLSLKEAILVEDRIPSIIHLEKQYDSFDISIQKYPIDSPNKSSDLEKDSVVILIKDDTLSSDCLYTVEIKLNYKFFTHTELIKKLTNNKIEFSAYEVIGDIIHLNLTDKQQEYKQIIADVLFLKTGKTIINKTGKIEDVFRFYHSEVLAGPQKLTTIHRENDVNFYLDLGSVYWCSRLQSERIRILKMIKKGDVVCDPFCGVGPHIVPAIKKGARALANDLNPSAIECLNKTLKINKLHCECIQNTDAGVFLKSLTSYKVDHVIFNLPEYSLDFIKYLEEFQLDFWLHVFFFCKDDVECVGIIYEKTKYIVKEEWLRKVRKVSPSKWVYKLEVKATDFFKIQTEQ